MPRISAASSLLIRGHARCVESARHFLFIDQDRIETCLSLGVCREGVVDMQILILAVGRQAERDQDRRQRTSWNTRFIAERGDAMAPPLGCHFAEQGFSGGDRHAVKDMAPQDVLGRPMPSGSERAPE